MLARRQRKRLANVAKAGQIAETRARQNREAAIPNHHTCETGPLVDTSPQFAPGRLNPPLRTTRLQAARSSHALRDGALGRTQAVTPAAGSDNKYSVRRAPACTAHTSICDERAHAAARPGCRCDGRPACLQGRYRQPRPVPADSSRPPEPSETPPGASNHKWQSAPFTICSPTPGAQP